MTKTYKDFDLEMTPMQETLEQVKTTLRQHFETVSIWDRGLVLY